MQYQNNLPPVLNEDINLDAPPVGLYNINSNELVPIRFAEVNANIYDNFAKVIIKHFYENLFSSVIDTEFVFPKTKNAIFYSLNGSLDNGEEIYAEVLSYKEGNKRFKDAKEKGDLAILSDINKTNPDLIRTKIGNIAPGQKVTITFSYVTQLDISLDKCYQFKFANIFIPRYVSKLKEMNFENDKYFEILPKIRFFSSDDIILMNEEFKKLLIQNPYNNKYLDQFENYMINKEFIQYNSGSGMLYPWSMRIEINTTFNISNIKYNNYLKNNQNEKLFDILINNNNQNNNSAILTSYSINFDYPTTDVIISFEDEQGFKIPKLLLNQHPLDRNEYALYFKYNPKFISESKDNDVININKFELEDEDTGSYLFVIDRSGSMAGSRIQTAKDSLVYFLKSLPEKSKFNVVSFGSNYELLYNDFIKANDTSVKNTLNKIESFKANMGGTELYKPFQEIFKSWKTNINKFRNNQIIRVFVLTDGSIDNPDGFLNLLDSEVKNFMSSKIDIRIYSLGIGNGCSDYLVKGIAEKGKGKSELAINNDDIVEKVIYLLDDSIKKNLKNFRIYFNNDKLNDSLIANSNLPAGEFNSAFKSFTETIEFFSRIELDDSSLKNLNDISLIISYEDVDRIEQKFAISLDRNIIKDDDTIFKIWVNQKVDHYFEKLADFERNYAYDKQKYKQLEILKDQLIELSIKYKCLNRLTSLFMVLKENNINKEQLKEKKIISLSNSDLKELEVPCNVNVSSMDFKGEIKTNVQKKSGIFSSIGNTISGLFGSSKPKKASPNYTFSCNQTANTNFSAKTSNLFSNQNNKHNMFKQERFDEKKNSKKRKIQSGAGLFNKNVKKEESESNNFNFADNDIMMEEDENEDFSSQFQNNIFTSNNLEEKSCNSPSLPMFSNNSNISNTLNSSILIKDNFELIESEILKHQLFNGSWKKNISLSDAMKITNWENIYNEFNEKNIFKLNDRTKDDQETIIFTNYVLYYIKYRIREQKILNKLKLIILKGEKFITSQLQINEIYNDEIKNIFGF